MNAPFERFDVLHRVTGQNFCIFEVHVMLGPNPPLGETQRRFIQKAIEDAMQAALSMPDRKTETPPVSVSEYMAREVAFTNWWAKDEWDGCNEQSIAHDGYMAGFEDAIAKVLEGLQPLADLEAFIKERQHHGGAACYESEGQDEQDPDNCQKCELQQILDGLRASGEDAIREPGSGHPSSAEESIATAPTNSGVGHWRKKPVVIEATQLDGTHDGITRVIDWVNSQTTSFVAEDSSTWPISSYYGEVTIRTLEGEMTAKKGDWIIRGLMGEFYPCKPDIFEATYEAIAATEATPVGESSQRRRHKEPHG